MGSYNNNIVTGLLGKCIFIEGLIFNLQLAHLNDFFSVNGRPALIFFYRPSEDENKLALSVPHHCIGGRKLWITDAVNDVYTGTCLFFIRLDVTKKITNTNVQV